MRPIVSEAELGGGWEVAAAGANPVPGAVMGGFLERVGAGAPMRVCARPEVTVVIQFGDAPLRVTAGGEQRRLGGVVAGLAPMPQQVTADRIECLELRLSPLSTRTLLGAAPSELRGEMVDLDAVWGRAANLLREQLSETPTWAERFTILTTFLAHREPVGAADPEVTACWDRIVATGGRVRVQELAEWTGWSRQRLWSRFTAQVGVTPKQATKIVRFRRALDRLAAGQPVADVAAICGYADQPHLHREVVAFAGTTPRTLTH
ncbi:AraC family transcriptional regulator [Nocardia sp. GTS18]|uniref:helix-turn-helix domain-containing protein n=1 Tax=Nocardia sp. GTS18 TaxID=1778064 RepID=UPI0015EEAF38|nr:AraC family transcriptional regulator [Nocardia sp. GTS18]